MDKAFKIIAVVLVIGIITVRQGSLWGHSFTEQQEKAGQKDSPMLSLDEAKKIHPETSNIEETDTATFLLLDKNGKEVATLLHTSPYADNISGYAGPVPLLITLNRDGKITDIQLLQNSDTPGFVEKVKRSGMLKRWNGMSIEEALATDVDAVSGATFTSRAIDASLKKRIAVYKNSNVTQSYSWNIFLKNIISAIILALAIYAFFKPAIARKFRTPILILSLLVLGIWQGSMLSFFQFYTWLTNGIPFGLQWGLLLILFAAVLLPIFTGRSFYCAYVCPFGAAQELMGKIDKEKIHLSSRILHLLLTLRKAVLFAILLLLIIGINFDFAYIEPFSAFNINAAPLFTLVIAFLSIALSLFVSRPWCRSLCPVGQTLDFLRRRQQTNKTK